MQLPFISKAVPVMLAGLILTGCGGVQVRPAFDLSAKPEDIAKDYTKEYDAKELRKYKKIYLTDFLLEVEMSLAKSGGNFATGYSKSSIKLDGVSKEALQALTDRAYDDLAKDLTAMGYEVIGPKQLAANAGYKEVVQKAVKDQPYVWESKQGQSHIYSAHKDPLILPTEGGERGASLTNKLGGMFSMPVGAIEQQWADKEKVPLLKVWLSLGIGDVSQDGAHSESKSELFVRGDGATRLAFRVPGGSYSSAFGGPDHKQPWDGSAIVNLQKDIVSGENYLGEKITRSQWVIISGNNDYFLNADEARFIAIAEKNLAAARKILLARLRQETN